MTQYVKFDGIHSNMLPATTGVPQGSILDPLLFNIYMNDIHGAYEHVHPILFADDHYNDVIMNKIASQITSLTIVYSTVYSGADQRKHQSSASLAFVRRIHRGPVNSPHKGPVTRKMFPFDDVIMHKFAYPVALFALLMRNKIPHKNIALFTSNKQQTEGNRKVAWIEWIITKC